jgi:hypothetical protein
VHEWPFDVQSPVLPIVPFEACLNNFTAAEVRCRVGRCSLHVCVYVYMGCTWVYDAESPVLPIVPFESCLN